MDRSFDRKIEKLVIQTQGTTKRAWIVFDNQLLATKFSVPMTSRPLICRPRLTALLDQGLRHPLTLVSAPAGFGKTTLLSGWGQSLAANDVQLAWLSLDEEDNDPRLFWTYVLSALQIQQPERFTPLLTQLQSQPYLPLNYVLTGLINLLAESTEHIVLILDDYHVITDQRVHSTLAYLVDHLPPQLNIILSTRFNPPLPLTRLRARQHLLEVRTTQLGCTAEETRSFFQEVMGIQFPDQVIQEVTLRTEGWLAGLHLLSLSLPQRADALTLLEATCGLQRYILDYLTEEVFGQQPQEVQIFLLSTCILDRLTASLCDAVTGQSGSQQMLERLEQANLFVVPLDHKRECYRYHILFAQALRYQLAQTHADLIPSLHRRASLWYTQHNQTIRATLHALSAHQWSWAADLTEELAKQGDSHIKELEHLFYFDGSQ